MTDVDAAPVEGQAAPVVGQDPPVVEAKWTDGLPDDLRGYVETKGFSDPAAVLNSYRNLEKLRGVPEERLVKLPEKMDEPGALDAVYDRLGRPEGADKYTRALGEDFNDDVFKGIASEAHKLGLSDGQFAGLQKITGTLANQLAEAQDAATAAAFDAWKGSNDEGFNAAARVMASVGVSEDQLAGILSGDRVQLYDFLANVAARSGEGQVTQGDPPADASTMSPAAARQKVSELMADKDFMNQYTSSNIKIRQPAIDRMSKLQEAAGKGV